MAFHVRTFWEDWSDQAAFETSRQIGLEDPAFRGLKEQSEMVASWFVPSWHGTALDSLPGMTNATTLHEAVATVIDAAMRSAVAPQTALKARGNELDEWWTVWREDLQNLDLTCVGTGFLQAELRGTAASFRAGLDHLRNYFAPILGRSADRFAERMPLDKRLPAALRITDVIWGALLGDRGWSGPARWVLQEIDPDRGWTYARTKLAAAKLPGILPDQEFTEFADVFFRTVVQVLRQRAREIGNLYVKNGYGIPVSSWELLCASGIANGLKGLPNDSGKILMEGSIDGFIAALEGAWKFAADLLRHRVSTGPSRFLAADVPTSKGGAERVSKENSPQAKQIEEER